MVKIYIEYRWLQILNPGVETISGSGRNVLEIQKFKLSPATPPHLRGRSFISEGKKITSNRHTDGQTDVYIYVMHRNNCAVKKTEFGILIQLPIQVYS